MRRPAPGLRRRIFTSLASRIAFFVLAATLVSALAVAGTSAIAVRAFLRAEVEDDVPEAALRARDRLELWYAQRTLDVATFAHSDLVVGGLANGAGAARGRPRQRAAELAEVEQYLGYVRDGLPVYSAIFVLDAKGRRLVQVGRDHPLPPRAAKRLASVAEPSVSGLLVASNDDSIQVVSAPIELAARHGRVSLHAVIPVDEIRSQVRAAVGEGANRLHVFDERGERIVSSLDASPAALAPEMASAAMGSPVEYSATDGVRVVAASLPLARIGWRVVYERDYGSTFAGIASILTRTVGMNVGIALVLACLAFAAARYMLRPLIQLSECAKRLRDGEDGVALPVVTADHEVGTLTRSFTEMVESLTRANEVLEQLAITDGLTRIHNHRYFQDQLATAVRQADSAGMPLSLVLIDIDDFKSLNDRYGHATGDRVLEDLAQLLIGTARECDVIARYGGEEFALLALETRLEAAVALAEQVAMAVRQHVFRGAGDGIPIRVTVSIGVAEYRGDRVGFFGDADRALYAAKHGGKDCVEVACADVRSAGALSAG